MSLIRLNRVTKKYEENLVLREVFFKLRQGDRVGLIGKNGAGKTTLLRLILGREEPSEGQVEIEDEIRIGYFSQFSELSGEQSIQALLADLFADIRDTECQLRQVEQGLEQVPAGPEQKQLLARYDRLTAHMERREGWTYQNRIDTVLSRLGFSELYRRRPIEQLSGGWRNRAALAKILLEDPDVLLLDEPTNFLDFEGLAWLEQWLEKLRGALILVSHDRHFLDRVVNRVVEVENFHLQEYRGNFTHYIREKKTRLKSLERQFQHEEELLIYEAEAIASRREAAKDPGRALERRMANIKKMTEPRPVERIITGLYANLRVGNKIGEVENLAKMYDDQLLFMDLSFRINKGDRLAVVGPNGCGKTTLLKVISGAVEADDGKISWFQGDGFVDYNQIFAELDPKDTVTHAVNIAPLAERLPRKKVNDFLQLLRFSEMNLRQRIGTLSGGQQARVALAQCLLSGAPLVMLDEPTNHLDLTSTQVMECALLHFPGAVVVVSHDRFFIDKVANRLLVFDGEGEVEACDGNWTVWQAGAETVERDRRAS